MGLDLIPLSIKSSTYENSTELNRKCPKPAASSIAIKYAIKWRPADPAILPLAKAVFGAEIGRRRASGTHAQKPWTQTLMAFVWLACHPFVSCTFCPRKAFNMDCFQAAIIQVQTITLRGPNLLTHKLYVRSNRPNRCGQFPGHLLQADDQGWLPTLLKLSLRSAQDRAVLEFSRSGQHATCQ